MSFDVKSEIMSSIGKTEDPQLKMILLLMLGVLEEIGSKIDGALADRKALRESVLNGHADTHHDDHEWVKERRRSDSEINALISRAMPLMVWGEAKMTDERNNKNHIGKMLFDTAGKAIWVLLGVVALAVVQGLPFVMQVAK